MDSLTKDMPNRHLRLASQIGRDTEEFTANAILADVVTDAQCEVVFEKQLVATLSAEYCCSTHFGGQLGLQASVLQIRDVKRGMRESVDTLDILKSD